MYFNDVELAILAAEASGNFIKEGILYMKSSNERKHRKQKALAGYVERWCCLRGNLLFCMKGLDRTSAATGLIVLERCSVELDMEELGNLFSFIIVQTGTEELIHLATDSETEREAWMTALHTASYECMRMQLDNLREQILLRTGRDPIQASVQLIANPITLAPEREDPFLEMCLSCAALPYSNSREPNTMIDILCLMPSGATWKHISQTEVVEASRNPQFMKTVSLGDESVPLKSRIKLIVYEVQELLTNTRVQIGQASFVLEELITAKKLHLHLLAGDASQVGSVMVMSWTIASPDQSVSTSNSAVNGDHWWQQERTFRTRKKDQLKPLFSNVACKVFRFPTANNHELSVCEYMGESKLAFLTPISLMQFWLRENNQWIDRLNKLDALNKSSEAQRHAILETSCNFTFCLTSAINVLESKHNGQTFKPSRLKGELQLAPIPVNLHINRLLVRNEFTQHGSSYDFISVGAFTAFTHKYKHGGLARQLKEFGSVLGSMRSNRLEQLVAISGELKACQDQTAELCENISQAFALQNKGKLESCQEQLQLQYKLLMELCEQHPLVVDALTRYFSNVDVGAQFDAVKQPLGLESWRFYTLSTRMAFSDLFMLSARCLQEVDAPMRADTVGPALVKCEGFLEKMCSLAAKGLTFAMLQESAHDPYSSNLRIMERHMIIMCQAVASLLTGIVAKVRCCISDKTFLHQLSEIGLLIHFEGLLSCHKAELGMLEDFIVAVNDLANIDFRFVENLSGADDYATHPPVISGSRVRLCISVPLPSASFSLLPKKLREGGLFRVIPVLFNIGINEEASIAERVGSVSTQQKCNSDSFLVLSSYYQKYEQLFGAVGSEPTSPYSVHELLSKLQLNLSEVKYKNVEVLRLAAEVSRKLNSVRFTSCKSAKDRTAMSITLEWCRMLQQDHELCPHMFTQALACLRSEGLRRQNSFKNTGVMSYSFSSLQLLSFPKLYRPPAGTFGKGEG